MLENLAWYLANPLCTFKFLEKAHQACTFRTMFVWLYQLFPLNWFVFISQTDYHMFCIYMQIFGVRVYSLTHHLARNIITYWCSHQSFFLLLLHDLDDRALFLDKTTRPHLHLHVVPATGGGVDPRASVR